jgi:hypothetical protein
VRDHSDALGQLEPSDARASMVTSSFHLDPRHFASVWDGRPPGGLHMYCRVNGLKLSVYGFHISDVLLRPKRI